LLQQAEVIEALVRSREAPAYSLDSEYMHTGRSDSVLLCIAQAHKIKAAAMDAIIAWHNNAVARLPSAQIKTQFKALRRPVREYRHPLAQYSRQFNKQVRRASTAYCMRLAHSGCGARISCTATAYCMRIPHIVCGNRILYAGTAYRMRRPHTVCRLRIVDAGAAYNMRYVR
jgi:hypothetical protein